MATLVHTVGSLMMLLVIATAQQAAGFDEKSNIASDEELKLLVRQLQEPATEMAALGRLIKYSKRSIQTGSLFVTGGDPATDERCAKARRAIWQMRTPARIRRALDDSDREVRFWAANLFEGNRSECGPWETFAPRLREIAERDPEFGIRAAAIVALRYDERSQDLLQSLRVSGKESDPWVLMRLFHFDSMKGEERSQWYAQAVRFLSGADIAMRRQWLQYIVSNSCNSSTAKIWRIEADPSLLEALRELEQLGSNEEKKHASDAIQALTEGHRWGQKKPNSPK